MWFKRDSVSDQERDLFYSLGQIKARLETLVSENSALRREAKARDELIAAQIRIQALEQENERLKGGR